MFVRDGAVVASLPAGPVQPGGVVGVGRYAAVADVQGNGVAPLHRCALPA